MVQDVWTPTKEMKVVEMWDQEFCDCWNTHNRSVLDSAKHSQAIVHSDMSEYTVDMMGEMTDDQIGWMSENVSQKWSQHSF